LNAQRKPNYLVFSRNDCYSKRAFVYAYSRSGQNENIISPSWKTSFFIRLLRDTFALIFVVKIFFVVVHNLLQLLVEAKSSLNFQKPFKKPKKKISFVILNLNMS
jgi:hypothetical protein